MKLKIKVLIGALGLTLALLSTALLAPIAGANATTGMMSGYTGTTTSGSTWSGSWCGGGTWSGSGTWGGTGMWGTDTSPTWLSGHPEALSVWLQLRANHIKALQTWYATYKANLSSTTAQQALHVLWTTYWNEMKAFYLKYGNGATWTCPSYGMWGGWAMGGGMMGGYTWSATYMWGSGYGASWMTSHPTGLSQWLTMRASQTAEMRAWMLRYASNLRSTTAQTALQTLMAQDRSQVKAFYVNHYLTVTSSRMLYGAGGWMGLGGMWGGWGW